MPDILIYVPAKYRDEFHKDFDEDECFFGKVSTTPELDKNWEFFWSMSVTPLKIKKNESKVMFTDGKNVIAEGKIIDYDKKNIYFKSLSEVNYPQPKKAPTRGFTYVKGASN